MLTHDKSANAVHINGDIYESDLTYFNAAIAELDDTKTIKVYINSFGGDLSTGIAMYNRIRSLPDVETINTGICASAASLAFLGGATRTMAVGSLIMNHRASVYTSGNVDDLKQSADALTKLDEQIASLIEKVTKQSPEVILDMMVKETYFSGTEAVELGLATRTDETIKAVALANLDKAHNHAGLQAKLALVAPVTEAEKPKALDAPAADAPPDALGMIWDAIKDLRSKFDNALGDIEKFKNSAPGKKDEDLQKEITETKEKILNLTKRLDELEKPPGEGEAPKNHVGNLPAAVFPTIPHKPSNSAGWKAQVDAEPDPEKKLAIIRANWK